MGSIQEIHIPKEANDKSMLISIAIGPTEPHVSSRSTPCPCDVGLYLLGIGKNLFCFDNASL